MAMFAYILPCYINHWSGHVQRIQQGLDPLQRQGSETASLKPSREGVQPRYSN